VPQRQILPQLDADDLGVGMKREPGHPCIIEGKGVAEGTWRKKRRIARVFSARLDFGPGPGLYLDRGQERTCVLPPIIGPDKSRPRAPDANGGVSRNFHPVHLPRQAYIGRTRVLFIDRKKARHLKWT